jgi:uncharacterized protein (TIGR00288 family)
VNNDTLKIAVFIDFDNIQIGVRNTLNRDFDVALVLDALKERGEVVTKVAYGNWKRAGDLTRTLTHHAVQMVQRDLTPRGDKNGADINLALDALELAINQPHINAFVIVGGDSDFIALVEKLKQYNKAVFVVGGRSFTSTVLARNCREFIAYDNLIETPVRRDETARRREVYPLNRAVPLVYRTLKLLRDREVQPQIGLLKSTLVQLDSTFNERDYGAGSFRDFVQKMADAHLLSVRQQGNSYVVEPLEGEPAVEEAIATSEPPSTEPEPNGYAAPNYPSMAPPAPAQPQRPAEEAVQLLTRVLEPLRGTNPRPLYLRNVKQMLRAEQPGFDEQQYGFQSLVDLLRVGQNQNLLRLQRDRRGALRVFIPGPPLPLAATPATPPVEATPADQTSPNGAEQAAPAPEANGEPAAEPQRKSEDSSEEDSQIAFLGYYRGLPGQPDEDPTLSLAAAVAAEAGGRKKRVRKPKPEGAPSKPRRSRPPRDRHLRP